MKTLNDVAKVYRSVAQKNLLQGPTRAFKTGNLYRTIGSVNTDQKMIKTQKGKSFLTLNYAPPGAKYGGFVEKGTYKMRSRPFAGNASKSPELVKAIKEYQDSEVEQINSEIYKRITVIFKPIQKVE